MFQKTKNSVSDEKKLITEHVRPIFEQTNEDTVAISIIGVNEPDGLGTFCMAKGHGQAIMDMVALTFKGHKYDDLSCTILAGLAMAMVENDKLFIMCEELYDLTKKLRIEK